MRTFLRAQHVAWTMISWCDIVRNRYGDGDAMDDLYRVGAPQPAHEPYGHIGPSHAAMVLPSPSGFSPSYIKRGTEC
jgi:hypothetical protein